MFINNFDPVAFQLFSFQIRWYSLAYIIGLILGWFYCNRFLIKDPKLKNAFDDYITYIIIGIIIGGRLGYVIIYNFKYYINNPLEILMIWNGGMSFHGALIGIIIVTIIFCKNRDSSPFYFLDLVAVTAPIGIFLGRISNFINSELFGRETDVIWSVKFIKIDSLNRHPSQLYEAIFEGLILFLILIYFRRKGFMKIPGLISSLFLIFYSFFRFVIEFFRVPDEQLGYLFFNLSMGQIMSLTFFITGIYLMKKNYEIK